MAQVLDDLHTEIDGCYECQRRGLAIQKICGLQRGEASALVMLIGLAPGRAAGAQKLAFAGNSFSRLSAWFSMAGFGSPDAALRKKLYLTSISKCRAVDDTPANRRFMWQNCRRFLGRQIDIVKPRLVGVLGAEVASYLLPKISSFDKEAGRAFTTSDINQGQLFPMTMHDCRWMVLPHPSGLSRVMNSEVNRERIISGLRRELLAIRF